MLRIQAATKAGIPRYTIYRVLKGHLPRYDRLLAICEALHLELTIEPAPGFEAQVETPETPEPTDIAEPKDGTPDTGLTGQPTKKDVYDAYYNSRSYQEVVDRLREIPAEVVGNTIDEMRKKNAHDDVDELKGIARKAGHTTV